MFISAMHKGLALIAFGTILLLNALGRISGTHVLIGVSIIIILIGCSLVAQQIVSKE
ncbi:MAG TPA: hypothetical protein VGT41_01060 [Candidatus Babeliales bacterium]|nr:hypothetical protein [Candidatus Babeliales bacterium]